MTDTELKQPHSWTQLKEGMDVYVSRGLWNYYHKDDWQVGVLADIKDHVVQIAVETNEGMELVYANKLDQLRIEG